MICYSIIIPYYNSKSTIDRAIDSIPLDDYVEIIIVDDCSDEDNQDYLKKLPDRYKDRNIRIVLSAENKGAGHSRNLGIGTAEGKWITFLDSDDYFLPYLGVSFKNYANSTADIIYFSATSICEETGEISTRHLTISHLIQNAYNTGSVKDINNLKFKFFGPVCKFIKIDFIRKNKILFQETRAFNDALFSVKCGFFSQNIAIDKGELYCITMSPASVSYKLSSEIIKERLKAICEVNNFFKAHELRNYYMPVFHQLIYSRKLGFAGFVDIFRYTLLIHLNPFNGIRKYFTENFSMI